MKTIEEKIAVMQAFAEGKTIEYSIKADKLEDWIIAENPFWDWLRIDYRVKEEPKEPQYVPFTFEDAEFLIGKAVKKDGGAVYSILSIQNSGIVVIHQLYKIVSYTWEELIRGFKFFPDNTPCGKLKQ